MATQIQKPALQEKRALIVDLEEQDKNNKLNMVIHGDDTSVPPLQQRKCTDTGCLILFLLVICGLIGICAYANIRGDTNRLTHGHDFRAELCGIQGLKHLPYVYWPKPYIELDYVQCIQACPSISNIEICLYNADHYTLRTDLECPPSYETYLYNGIYCLPADQSYRDRILNDVLMQPMEIIKRSFGDMQRT